MGDACCRVMLKVHVLLSVQTTVQAHNNAVLPATTTGEVLRCCIPMFVVHCRCSLDVRNKHPVWSSRL